MVFCTYFPCPYEFPPRFSGSFGFFDAFLCICLLFYHLVVYKICPLVTSVVEHLFPMTTVKHPITFSLPATFGDGREFGMMLVQVCSSMDPWRTVQSSAQRFFLILSVQTHDKLKRTQQLFRAMGDLCLFRCHGLTPLVLFERRLFWLITFVLWWNILIQMQMVSSRMTLISTHPAWVLLRTKMMLWPFESKKSQPSWTPMKEFGSLHNHLNQIIVSKNGVHFSNPVPETLF